MRFRRIEKTKRGKKLFSNLPFKKLIIVFFCINFALLAAVIALQKFLPPEVPLYYGSAQGSNQLAPSIALTIPVIFSLFITTINPLISLLLKNEFLKKILIMSIPAATFFSIVTIIKIFLLVGSF